jgi:hypothetical protein
MRLGWDMLVFIDTICTYFQNYGPLLFEGFLLCNGGGLAWKTSFTTGHRNGVVVGSLLESHETHLFFPSAFLFNF